MVSMVVLVITDGAGQPMAKCHAWYIKKKKSTSQQMIWHE
jgi:hypothetical protein